MHLAPDANDTHAPEEFTKRIFQARLEDFWRSAGPECRDDSEYNIFLTERMYERLCGEFLTTLPPAFALRPDKQWDELCPMLPLQREIFHISLLDSTCYNFRPAFLQDRRQVQRFPKYKQVLLSSQEKTLAMAGVNILRKVSALHAMMSRSQTRFADVIQPAFEAAVLLVYLCIHHDFSLSKMSRRRKSLLRASNASSNTLIITG
jgi:hypothetical protein